MSKYRKNTVDVEDFVTLAATTMNLSMTVSNLLTALTMLQKRVAKLEKEALR